MADAPVLVDGFGRRVTSLRISLTDHCNFHCVYCMPPEGVPPLEKSDFLTARQIVRFVRVIGRIGVGRIRLTGGEPLLRSDIVEIVESLRKIETVRELSLTTNGSLLERWAKPLKAAGLDRMNISLDSLDPARFREVTQVSQYARVRAGIEAAAREGFPVKLNVVVLSGMSAAEILDFARLAVDHECNVRFLEFMPLCGSGWQADLVYPIPEVREIIRRHFDLEEMPRGDRPAQEFSVAGGGGRIGFISPLSEPFCDRCSRIRLTADGRIRPCLFSDAEFALADLLKNGAADEELEEAIRFAVRNKPWGSGFREEPFREGEARTNRVPAGPFIRSIGG